MPVFTVTKHHAIALVAATLLLAAGPVAAHPGHETGLLLAGLEHLLTSAHYLLATLAVALWSVFAYGKSRQAIYAPVAFLAALLAGVLLDHAGVHLHAPGPIVLASLLVLALMAACRKSAPQPADAV